MKCDEAQRLLVTEGTAFYERRRVITLSHHLRRCGDCREEAALLDAEARLFRRAFAAGPSLRPDFTAEVMRLIS